jgi:hypothetical protein
MFSVAGLVAEVKLAGYPAAYVEEDVAGRTSIAGMLSAWPASRPACRSAATRIVSPGLRLFCRQHLGRLRANARLPSLTLVPADSPP